MRFREAFGVCAYRCALLSGFATGWTAYGVRVALIPLLAVHLVGEGPQVAGLALALFAVGNAVALTFTGRLTDRVGRKPLILTGLVVCALATAGLGLTSTVAGFVVAVTPGGLGVREAVLMYALGPALGDDLAVVAALMLRLVWVAAEIFAALVLGPWGRPMIPSSTPDEGLDRTESLGDSAQRQHGRSGHVNHLLRRLTGGDAAR